MTFQPLKYLLVQGCVHNNLSAEQKTSTEDKEEHESDKIIKPPPPPTCGWAYLDNPLDLAFSDVRIQFNDRTQCSNALELSYMY